MKCLLKYQWVKLPRNQIPPGKGVMGAWTRMASRAAFRNGQAHYCGYINKVNAGGWAGPGTNRRTLRTWLHFLHAGCEDKETDLSSHGLGRKVLWRALYGP